MQQRRLRLGDILDDYCPRERRITNHAVVAMIEDEIRQTRCTTCDAEHEFKQAKVPVARRRKSGDAATVDVMPSVPGSSLVHDSLPRDSNADLFAEPETFLDDVPLAAEEFESSSEGESRGDEGDEGEEGDERREDEGPVHRRLIRATLPRPEGQAPERKDPDFTMRQPSGGRFEQQRNGQRPRGRQQARPAGAPHGQPSRQGNPRQGFGRSGPGSDQGSQRQHNGNRPGGNTAGQRGGRPFGPNRGPRNQGGGQGRKRGR
jgi:hypothetical protein